MLAVGLRAWRMLCSNLDRDGSVCGLLGLEVLQGRWPIFFLGQDFMGALDGYLLAPLILVFGHNSLTVNLLPPLCAVAAIFMIFRALRLVLDDWGALVGAAYLTVPPALAMFYAGQPQNHYALSLTLGAYVIWQTLYLWREPQWAWWRAGLLGLVAGLGLWTNFQTVVVVLPAALFLLGTGGRRLRPAPLVSVLAGAVLGAAPLIYYDLSRPMTHMGQAELFDLSRSGQYLRDLLLNAWPITLGFNTPTVEGVTAPWSAAFLVYLAVTAALLLTAWWLLRGLRWHRGRWAWLPLGVLAVNLGILVATDYGRELKGVDQRYLLPVTLAMPFLWGALGSRLGRWRPAAACALAGLVILVHLAAYPGYRGGVIFCTEGGYFFKQEPAAMQAIAELRKAGFGHIYTDMAERKAYLAGMEPQFAGVWQEPRVWASAAVDAADDPAYQSPIGPSLELLGVGHSLWNGQVYHGFRQPEQVERLVPRGLWRARTLDGRDLGPTLGDGSLTTGLVTAGKAVPGEGLVVDLGREEVVGGLALVPVDFLETPAGLRIEAAGADGAFETLHEVAEDYWGPFYWSGTHPFLKARYPRVESYFPARPMRYLRLTHLGHSNHRWSVMEMVLWGPGEPDRQQATWPASAAELLRLAGAWQGRRIYADAWTSAWLAWRAPGQFQVLTAEYFSDVYGAVRPPVKDPLWLDPSPGNLLAVCRRDEEHVAAYLASWNVRFERRNAGRLTVFRLKGRSPGRRLEIKSVTSPVDAEHAAMLASGVPAGLRWASLRPQGPGVWLDLDLGEPQTVAGMELACPDHPLDYPRRLTAMVSDDGATWRTAVLRQVGPLAFSGLLAFTAQAPRMSYRLDPPVTTRHLRLETTEAQPLWWWSVQELSLHSPHAK